MTPNAQHKRAERQRRRDAGYKRVEVWLSAEDSAWVNMECERVGMNAAEVIQDCIEYMRISG